MKIAKTLHPLIAALLIAAVSPPVHGETIIRKSVTYFSIGGKTASDLDREMVNRGPFSHRTGRRHPGATQIKFNGSATFVNKGSRCVIGGAKVTLSTKLILPRWTNRKRANAQMALIWDTLSADIKRHEERHAEIARNHARSLEKTILGISSSRDCATLKARVNHVSHQAMVAHDKDQQRFDRIESANFENRMIRLLRYRISQKAAN
ncbi:DUF922 domain-containing Zn-dependent protease [Rhizobium sp.]